MGPYREMAEQVKLATVVEEDMHKAAKVYAFLSSIRPTCLLGGSILSWASGIAARDWDYYMPLSALEALTVEGWKFTDITEKISQGDYTYRILNDGWRISNNKQMDSEQIILIPEKNTSPLDYVWNTFDYAHCMLGFNTRLESVTVGLQIVADGKLIVNPKTEGHRKSKQVLKKLKDKSIFGQGKDTLKSVNNVFDRFQHIAGYYMNSSNLDKGYEDFRKALNL